MASSSSVPFSESQAAAVALVRASTSDPPADLREERARASFPSADLTNHLYGEENAARRRYLETIVANKPILRKDDFMFLNRSELYRRALGAAMELPKLQAEYGLSSEDLNHVVHMMGFPLPIDLHFSMFVTTIRGQGTEEQVAHWLPKAMNFGILGTYAQTEMGHGTFLRGLETIAVYDANAREFDFHSPTDSSIKWWPGGLGKSATHCILMARLFLHGKDYGPHPFIIQLRSLETHHPLPGVELGDIGPKFGYNSIDNGYLRLTHYRAPLDSMLMRFAKVSPDGVYSSPPVAKSNYATMVYIRAGMVFNSGETLAKAITIATRFSTIRRQGEAVAGKHEPRVIEFQTQQHQLFTVLSQTFALYFTGKFMMDLYQSFIQQSGKGDFSALPEVHATSAGLKAFCTAMTTDGIERARRLCGGHGYHTFSGLAALYSNYLPHVTYEGENTVMYLQTGRYLIKAVQSAVAGETLSGNVRGRGNAVRSYLNNLARLSEERWGVREPADVLSPALQIDAFRHRAAQLVSRVGLDVRGRIAAGADFKAAFDANTVDTVEATKAHCSYILLINFVEAVAKIPATASFYKPLKALCDLFALTQLESEVGSFLEDGYVSARQASFVRSQARLLLAQIRPDAIAITDAFDFGDYTLNSSLGRYDGDMYRDMYRRAQQEPLNSNEVPPGYNEYLKPYLTAKL